MESSSPPSKAKKEAKPDKFDDIHNLVDKKPVCLSY